MRFFLLSCLGLFTQNVSLCAQEVSGLLGVVAPQSETHGAGFHAGMTFERLQKPWLHFRGGAGYEKMPRKPDLEATGGIITGGVARTILAEAGLLPQIRFQKFRLYALGGVFVSPFWEETRWNRGAEGYENVQNITWLAGGWQYGGGLSIPIDQTSSLRIEVSRKQRYASEHTTPMTLVRFGFQKDLHAPPPSPHDDEDLRYRGKQ